MVQYVLLILFSAIPSTAFTQQSIPIKDKNGKWALYDAAGNNITKPIYTTIEPVDDYYFRVAVGGKIKDGVLSGEKWGIIDNKGQDVLKPEYDQIDDIFNGLALICKNNKFGFVNHGWNTVIEPVYDFVGDPNEQGYLWVNKGGSLGKDQKGTIRGGKFGVFNIKGEVILPVEYKSIGSFSLKQSVYDVRTILFAESDIERLMLESGSHSAAWAKPLELRPGYMFPNSVGFAFSNKNSLEDNGVADLDGDILIQAGKYKKVAFPTDGIAIVSTENRLTGYHNVADNSFIRSANITTAFAFRDGVAVGIDSRNKWRLYNMKMEPLSDAYDWISPKVGNYYLTRSGNCMFLLSSEDFGAKFEADLIFPPSSGYMAYKDKTTGLWGFLNGNGEIAVQPKYKYAYSFLNGASKIRFRDEWGVMDPSLKERIEPQWAYILPPMAESFTKIWAQSKDGKYHCIDWESGRQAFKETYSDVWNFTTTPSGKKYAIVQNERFGCIDPDGNILVPLEMNDYYDARSAMNYLERKNITQWKPIDSYRFSIFLTLSRNEFRTNEIIPSEYWDY